MIGGAERKIEKGFIEPTCAHARWALMPHFLKKCRYCRYKYWDTLSFFLDFLCPQIINGCPLIHVRPTPSVAQALNCPVKFCKEVFSENAPSSLM